MYIHKCLIVNKTHLVFSKKSNRIGIYKCIVLHFRTVKTARLITDKQIEMSSLERQTSLKTPEIDEGLYSRQL